MTKTLVNKTIHTCEFCKHEFKSDIVFAKHACRDKTRWNSRDLAPNRIGFQCWISFFKKTSMSHKNNTMQDFIKSPYFTAFVKFGLYCSDSKVINIPAFVDWLLAHNIKVDHWNRDSHYTKFLIDYLRTEDAFDAIARSIETCSELAEEYETKTKDVLKNVSPYKISSHVATGKISPWLLYQSNSGVQLLSTLTEDNVKILIDYIDPEKWNAKFMRDKQTTKKIKDLLNEIGF